MPQVAPKRSRPTKVQLPRYAEVEKTVRRQIRNGSYQRGDQLPSEMDLAERFQVSRFTIREALDNLTEAGLISRQQGARSRVIGNERQSVYTFSVGSAEDLPVSAIT